METQGTSEEPNTAPKIKRTWSTKEMMEYMRLGATKLKEKEQSKTKLIPKGSRSSSSNFIYSTANGGARGQVRSDARQLGSDPNVEANKANMSRRHASSELESNSRRQNTHSSEEDWLWKDKKHPNS